MTRARNRANEPVYWRGHTAWLAWVLPEGVCCACLCCVWLVQRSCVCPCEERTSGCGLRPRASLAASVLSVVVSSPVSLACSQSVQCSAVEGSSWNHSTATQSLPLAGARRSVLRSGRSSRHQVKAAAALRPHALQHHQKQRHGTLGEHNPREVGQSSCARRCSSCKPACVHAATAPPPIPQAARSVPLPATRSTAPFAGPDPLLPVSQPACPSPPLPSRPRPHPTHPHTPPHTNAHTFTQFSPLRPAGPPACARAVVVAQPDPTPPLPAPRHPASCSSFSSALTASSSCLRVSRLISPSRSSTSW